MILASFADDVEALEDVDDVVDASAFDAQLQGHLVQFQQVAIAPLEVGDELAGELLQTFLLAVV